MKECHKCRMLLDASCFHKNKSKKDGLHDGCKKCRNHPRMINPLTIQGLKECPKCLKVLPFESFHKHSRNGLHSQCKLCRKIESKLYFLKDREGLARRKKESELNRPRQTAINRKRSIANYIKNNPFKVEARRIFINAKNSGQIKKEPCKICGALNAEGHHADYTKPFDVMWFCRTHHAAWHRLFSTEP